MPPEQTDTETTPGEELVTIYLSPDAFRALQEIAKLRGVSPGQALQEALGTDLLILRAQQAGGKVVIKRGLIERALLKPDRELVGSGS